MSAGEPATATTTAAQPPPPCLVWKCVSEWLVFKMQTDAESWEKDSSFLCDLWALVALAQTSKAVFGRVVGSIARPAWTLHDQDDESLAMAMTLRGVLNIAGVDDDAQCLTRLRYDVEDFPSAFRQTLGPAFRSWRLRSIPDLRPRVVGAERLRQLIGAVTRALAPMIVSVGAVQENDPAGARAVAWLFGTVLVCKMALDSISSNFEEALDVVEALMPRPTRLIFAIVLVSWGQPTVDEVGVSTSSFSNPTHRDILSALVWHMERTDKNGRAFLRFLGLCTADAVAIASRAGVASAASLTRMLYPLPSRSSSNDLTAYKAKTICTASDLVTRGSFSRAVELALHPQHLRSACSSDMAPVFSEIVAKGSDLKRDAKSGFRFSSESSARRFLSRISSAASSPASKRRRTTTISTSATGR